MAIDYPITSHKHIWKTCCALHHVLVRTCKQETPTALMVMPTYQTYSWACQWTMKKACYTSSCISPSTVNTKCYCKLSEFTKSLEMINNLLTAHCLCSRGRWAAGTNGFNILRMMSRKHMPGKKWVTAFGKRTTAWSTTSASLNPLMQVARYSFTFFTIWSSLNGRNWFAWYCLKSKSPNHQPPTPK